MRHAAELRRELRLQIVDLRDSFELKVASTVKQLRLYGAILGHMALPLGIVTCRGCCDSDRSRPRVLE